MDFDDMCESLKDKISIFIEQQDFLSKADLLIFIDELREQILIM